MGRGRVPRTRRLSNRHVTPDPTPALYLSGPVSLKPARGTFGVSLDPVPVREVSDVGLPLRDTSELGTSFCISRSEMSSSEMQSEFRVLGVPDLRLNLRVLRWWWWMFTPAVGLDPWRRWTLMDRQVNGLSISQ
jgi:hypothetical protein